MTGPAFALAIAFTATLCGCAEALRSDSANALRRAEGARQEALESSRIASGQAHLAQPVSGAALVRLLSGNTHVSEFRRRTSDAKPYFTTYQYFGPDGVFIARDTWSRRTPAYQAVGRWRVNDAVLCMTENNGPGSEGCYTVRLQSDGVIQFWIHKPGDPFHNLITSSVRIIRPGLQTPEYASTSAP